LINPNLFKDAAAVDSTSHRNLRLAHPVRDWAVASGVNAMFVASVEFGDACCEYPLVFVEAGKDQSTGQSLIAPVAVLGLLDKQNLYADGGQWRASYMPALLRAYPFGIARQDQDRVLVVLDQAYEGWSQTEGQLLFDAQGQPSALLNGMREQLETIETEIQRTRLFGSLLIQEGLLQPMRFDATLPDGKTLTVDGFLTVDEKKLGELPDAKVLEFYRNGVMGLIHAHQISLRHMRRLVDWHAARLAVSTPGDLGAVPS
jgi:SapC